MARQKGMFRLTGTIGGVNYYRAGGEFYSRKAGGGFNKTAIKEKASMQRVRDFNDEFARCVAAKKAFRLALTNFIGDLRSRELQSNMMRLFLELKNLDRTNAIGSRKIKMGLESPEGRALVRNFIFLPELDMTAKPDQDPNFTEIIFNGLEKLEFEHLKIKCCKLEGDPDLAILEAKLIQEFSFNSIPLRISYPQSEEELVLLYLEAYRHGGLIRRGIKLVMTKLN